MRKRKYKLYISYGSNMNMQQMKMRCPNARPIGSYILEDYKLEFRGVANVIECEGAKTPVALWLITETCEKALDRYEGYPRLYRKEYVTVTTDIKGTTREVKAMVYVMNTGAVSEPSKFYYDTIEQGYKDFNIELKSLELARKESIR